MEKFHQIKKSKIGIIVMMKKLGLQIVLVLIISLV